MKKIVLAVLLAVLAAGCGALKRDEELLVKNSCKGVWILVADGDGRKLVDRIEPGGIYSVSIEGWRGTTVYLLASGYDLTTNQDRGTAQTSRTIPRATNYTGPSQIAPWDIRSLSHSSRDGGCLQ